MKFTDGNELLNIRLIDTKTGMDFAPDFFDDAPRADENGVHHVEDARYPLDMALDMVRGEGEYAETPGVDCKVEYDVTGLETGETVACGVEESED